MKHAYPFLICVALSGPAYALEVYPGCEVPASGPGKSVHFVDPVLGSDQGDGTSKKPWKTLAFVLNPANRIIATNSRKGDATTPLLPVNPNGALKGGDTLMLMSGNYGDVALQNVFNSAFITVMPAPGQTPVISHLKVGGATRWIFQNITFRYSNPPLPKGATRSFNNLTQVIDGWQGANSNIIFDSSTFTTATDVSGWSNMDWLTRPENYSLSIRSPCVSVTNSQFTNVFNALNIMAPNTLIKNNIIDHFSNDAIDLTSGNVTIFGNTIQNGMTNKDSTLHADAIQGWSQVVNGKKVLNENVMIDSNKVYNYSNVNGNYLQGIDMFNDLWNNLTIQNNVVVTNTWHGITVWGAKNSKILNNTVMPSDPAYQTWISVMPSPTGPSQNVLVRNNAAYQIIAQDKSLTFDHNATSIGFTTLEGGKPVKHNASDSASKNLVVPSMTSGFMALEPTKAEFNLKPKTQSALIGAGIVAAAPPRDIVGRDRTSSVDLGAYVH